MKLTKEVAWATAKRWLAALSVGGLVGIFVAFVILAGECNAFRGQSRQDTAPVVAPPTQIEAKSPERLLEKVNIVAIDPSEKDRSRLAEKYHRPDLVAQKLSQGEPSSSADTTKNPQTLAEILGERTLPPMPAGGTALLTLEPGGRVEMTVAPNPEKLFEWRSVYEMGAVYGVGTAGDTRGRAWGAVEPLRFGRIHLRVEAGVDLRAGQTDGYAMAGAVWRSR